MLLNDDNNRQQESSIEEEVNLVPPAIGRKQLERIIYPTLPLAIYRELAAHLRQVQGIKIELLPQNSQKFDYAQSQTGGLLIEYPQESSARDREQIDKILSYYGRRYGAYQRYSVET